MPRLNCLCAPIGAALSASVASSATDPHLCDTTSRSDDPCSSACVCARFRAFIRQLAPPSPTVKLPFGGTVGSTWFPAGFPGACTFVVGSSGAPSCPTGAGAAKTLSNISTAASSARSLAWRSPSRCLSRFFPLRLLSLSSRRLLCSASSSASSTLTPSMSPNWDFANSRSCLFEPTSASQPLAARPSNDQEYREESVPLQEPVQNTE
mmetsp:Transcript_11678/g.32949  ORF Transcript_11678/g.32949 Transcript_11678/m.32949 type:complete len:208 (-) Transcript_11678:36-659(-)